MVDNVNQLGAALEKETKNLERKDLGGKHSPANLRWSLLPCPQLLLQLQTVSPVRPKVCLQQLCLY